ncbi:MAG: ABC transporter permease, partial [Bdellovibrionota bacterium]
MMMTRIMRFLQQIQARNKQFYRDREAMAWNFAFPILVVLGFGFMFSGGEKDLFKIGTIGAIAQHPYSQTKHLQFVSYPTAEIALARLKRHQLDLVVNVDSSQYWINESSPKGYLSERLLLASLIPAVSGTAPMMQRVTVAGSEIRYVDWLISGLLALNMMFNALFGVGYVLVRYRKTGVLKRLKATPLGPFEFLASQLISRYLLIVAVTTVVYVGCHLLLQFKMEGSYLDLFVVLSGGAICISSLGLMIASRTASEELAGGLLNLASWPMMFLSGVWFSLEGADPWVRTVAKVFPLTPVIDAARLIMTEGVPLSALGEQMGSVAVFTVVFL